MTYNVIYFDPLKDANFTEPFEGDDQQEQAEYFALVLALCGCKIISVHEVKK